MQKLMTSVRSKRLNYDSLSVLSTPPGTETHRPLPHSFVYDKTADALEAAGFEITSEEHAVNNLSDDTETWDQYFGLLNLQFTGQEEADPLGDDVILTAGIRNAHNKRFSYGFCCGATVCVCDNLTFHGEVMAHRRHTKNIQNDLDETIRRAVRMFKDSRDLIANRHATYQKTQLLEEEVNDVVVRAWRKCNVIPKTLADSVLDEFHTPSHDEHKQYDSDKPNLRSVWRLYNAFSASLGGRRTAMPTLVTRTMALHDLLDKECVEV